MDQKNEFPKKYLNKLKNLDGFEESTQSLSNEDLKKLVMTSAKQMFEIEQAMDVDEGLLKAKEHVKELAAPYKESMGLEEAKMKYACFVLESRGLSAK